MIWFPPGSSGRMRDMTQDPDPGGRRPGMLAAGVTLLAAAAGVAVLVRRDLARLPFAGLDRAWLSTVIRLRDQPLTDVFKVLSLIGGPDGATVIVTVLAVALVLAGRWRTALFVALVQSCGSTCSDLIKHFVLRVRPPHPLVTADIGSFPSGHTITTLGVGLALTAALTRPGRRRRRALAGVAVATAVMMFCRTYLAAHWLSDTLESLLVGSGVALVLWWAFAPWLARDRAAGWRSGWLGAVLPGRSAPGHGQAADGGHHRDRAGREPARGQTGQNGAGQRA
jgi:membrane-associated phospholipid phosphatase